jgi:hypothetical protein
MQNPLTYIKAVPDEHTFLTEIVIQSKKSWGYSDELMTLWKPDFVINAAYISENDVIKVLDRAIFIGFFALKKNAGAVMELDHLWLTPDNIRKGYGRQIFKQIFDILRSKAIKQVSLVAEPNAKGFYDKMGGVVTGKLHSKISGRDLDIYEFILPD